MNFVIETAKNRKCCMCLAMCQCFHMACCRAQKFMDGSDSETAFSIVGS
jgi:hypothetical protein